MKRDPSIHITRSRFEEILNLLEVSYFPTDAFFTLARKNSLDARVIEVSNKQVTKQVTKITLANKGDTSLCAEIIYATRIKLRHKGVRKITEVNQKEWTLCKKLAEICNTFCDDFNFPSARSGFIKYIEIGIKRCEGNYRNLVPRLVSMAENITLEYEAEQEMLEYIGNNYNTKQDVIAIHNYYIKTIASSTGIYENFENNPEKYVHFCRIHKLLKERGWWYTNYIDAQFEALAFCNGIPQLDQMYGDKAIERFNKYMYKQRQERETDTPVVEGSLWSKISSQS